jgi:uncharacterized protein
MTSPDEKPPQPQRPCPICGKQQVQRYRPFCSKRCADIDLNRWLKGGYAIPTSEDDEEDGGGTPGEDERR